MSMITIYTLCELYKTFAERHYRRADRTPTREHYNINAAVDRFCGYAGKGSWDVNKVTAPGLKAWREQLIAEEEIIGGTLVDGVVVGGTRRRKLSRNYINACIDRVRGMFRWGVEEGLVSPLVTESLRCVRPLQPFRSEAREIPPRVPPQLEEIERITNHLTNIPKHVLQILRLTNCRPSEILELRHGEMILFEKNPRLQPVQHKGAWLGLAKVIPLVPEAAEILRRYHLPFLPDEFVFRAELAGGRISKTGHYTLRGLELAFKRACVKAGLPPSCVPYDTRRAGARRVRRTLGLDHAQASLGHLEQSTTEIYAPMNPDESDTFAAALAAAECLRPPPPQTRSQPPKEKRQFVQIGGRE